VVPVVPVPVATAVIALALGLLIVSFGRDAVGQEREERRDQQQDPAFTRRR